MIPPKLQAGSTIRVVAPARSRALIGADTAELATARLRGLGLAVSFGDHVDECDRFVSSAVASRLSDLHDAFRDPAVDGILTVIGGYSCNDLLDGIDWSLVADHPKVLCGYSDITALQNACWAHTGLVTYSGPHWSTFGMELHLEPTIESFRACLFDEAPIPVAPARHWSDDAWYLDQHDRTLIDNEGWWPLQPGSAEGTIVGGNLATFALLFGTRHMPDLDGTIVAVEDDLESRPWHVRRNLRSLVQQPGFEGVRGLVVGRFQRASEVERDHLEAMLAAMPELAGLPVLANVDLGHTDPMITYPIGGRADLVVDGPDSRLVITEH